jgi:hypothetical protein
MTRITKVQRAALMKLMDGDRHRLEAFTTSTQRSLQDRGMIELTCGGTRVSRDYHITPAGREALGLVP